MRDTPVCGSVGKSVNLLNDITYLIGTGDKTFVVNWEFYSQQVL